MLFQYIQGETIVLNSSVVVVVVMMASLQSLKPNTFGVGHFKYLILSASSLSCLQMLHAVLADYSIHYRVSTLMKTKQVVSPQGLLINKLGSKSVLQLMLVQSF